MCKTILLSLIAFSFSVVTFAKEKGLYPLQMIQTITATNFDADVYENDKSTSYSIDKMEYNLFIEQSLKENNRLSLGINLSAFNVGFNQKEYKVMDINFVEIFMRRKFWGGSMNGRSVEFTYQATYKIPSSVDVAKNAKNRSMFGDRQSEIENKLIISYGSYNALLSSAVGRGDKGTFFGMLEVANRNGVDNFAIYANGDGYDPRQDVDSLRFGLTMAYKPFYDLTFMSKTYAMFLYHPNQYRLDGSYAPYQNTRSNFSFGREGLMKQYFSVIQHFNEDVGFEFGYMTEVAGDLKRGEKGFLMGLWMGF